MTTFTYVPLLTEISAGMPQKVEFHLLFNQIFQKRFVTGNKKQPLFSLHL